LKETLENTVQKLLLLAEIRYVACRADDSAIEMLKLAKKSLL